MRLPLCLLLVCLACLPGRAEPDPLATLRPGHPRLLVTDGTWAALAADRDPLRLRLHARIIEVAEQQLKEPPIAHVLVGPRLLEQSRRALGHVTTGALAYRLTGDRRFLAHAREVMLTAAAFPDWNPDHFLDVAEMAAALALGYDWLHADLTPAERTAIKQALLDKALAFAGPAYARADPDRESFPFVRGNLTNNWNQVCNGGFLLAALALADEEPALARLVIAGVRETLPHAMAAYQPDGAYPEGPVYWGYGTGYNVLILAALESALGGDLGLGGTPAFDRTVLFRHYVQSPTGLSFNFADGRPGLGADAGMAWLGRRYGHPAVVANFRRLLADELARAPNPGNRFLATQALWLPPEPAAAAPLPLDVVFAGPSKVAIFRGAWDDPRALWTGLKAGSNRVNHGHLDLGSFLLDADGERWAVDLGPDDYNLPGYWSGATAGSPRWQYYRLNNSSHNTLTPGALRQSPDADAPVIAHGSAPERAFAVADITGAYPAAAEKFLRGLALLDRSRVLVQDEVTALAPGTPLTWRMLTGAKVRLDGPRRAVLTQNGRELHLEILAPAHAAFSTHPATPPTARENQNPGITALEAVVPPAAVPADVQVAVLLTPAGEKWPPRPAPDLAPLSTWK